MSSAKKHHFVPQMLLRRFADDKGKLTVHRLDRADAHTASVRDLGHRNQGHTLYFPGREPNQDVLEQQMSDLEGEASRAVDRLAAGRATTLDEDDREVLAWFMALQWTRHRSTLGAVRAAARAASPDASGTSVDDYALRSGGLIAGPAILLHAWQMRTDPDARPKESYNGVVVNLLHRFEWRVVRYRRPVLVVSDNSVCMSGVADGETAGVPEAWTRHGAGVGTGTCRRITCPLTPRLGLLLENGRDPTHLKAEVFNRLTVHNSREFVAHHQEWPHAEPRLHQSLHDDLWLQRRLLPAFGPAS